MATSRIDNPVLYQWDLNENSTRYDYPRSRPADEVLQIQLSISAFVNAVVAVASFILILSILKSQKLRSNAFNLYILFMAIPDFIGSFLCLLTCAMSAPGSDFYSETMCGFQAFYLVFAFAGNAWTNVAIVHQVNKLLNYSQLRRRYFPPTPKQVLSHVALVYTYSILWGVLVAYPFKGMPLRTKLYYGFACFPMEEDTTSTWFFYLAFLPGILLIPFLYSMYSMGRIMLKGLLPKAGKRRNLSIFLMRLIAFYFFGWLPFVLTCFAGNFVQLGPWWFWAGGMISHFQGFISSLVVYKTSKSIKLEMDTILFCRARKAASQQARDSKSIRSSARRFRSLSIDMSGAVYSNQSQRTSGSTRKTRSDDENGIQSSKSFADSADPHEEGFDSDSEEEEEEEVPEILDQQDGTEEEEVEGNNEDDEVSDRCDLEAPDERKGVTFA